jgi:hypothetical protein
MELFVNDPGTTLGAAITSTGATSITVSSSSGYPASGNFRIAIDSELLLVTAVSGTTWTVTRGVEGTTAATHTNGTAVNAVATAGSLQARFSDAQMAGLLASLPVAANVGDTYSPADSLYRFRYDGTVWQAFYGNKQVGAIDGSGWSWYNQQGSSFATSHGPLVLTIPNSGNGVTILFKAVPTAPYTVTAGLKYMGASTYGVVLRDSGTNKFVWFRITPSGSTWAILIDKWDNATSLNSGSLGAQEITQCFTDVFYLRMSDDGTNRHFAFSTDGFHFLTVFSVANTDFITPDGVGFGVYETDTTFGSAGTVNLFLSIIDYVEA